MKNNFLRIGTAGWGLPATTRGHFPAGNSLLERYSQIFNAVEINTSFYRAHQKKTYERWAAATPSDFQFAVKMPKQMTHDKKLAGVEALLDSFLEEASGLQTKLGPLLIQLPPTLRFKEEIANSFFALLQNKFNGKVVLEPRHISWGQEEAIAMVQSYNIAYVNADPVKVPAKPAIKHLFGYYRLHGSPEVYSSSYDAAFLARLAKSVDSSSWIIFDNTKLGAATQNALNLKLYFENMKKSGEGLS
jgi:uncharacterized protein YecE (DUF72 family)